MTTEGEKVVIRAARSRFTPVDLAGRRNFR